MREAARSSKGSLLVLIEDIEVSDTRAMRSSTLVMPHGAMAGAYRSEGRGRCIDQRRLQDARDHP